MIDQPRESNFTYTKYWNSVNDYITFQVPPASTINNFSLCIYGFRVFLTVNSDYFLKHHYLVYFCNGEVWCFLCGADWILKYFSDEL
jgi:hypothetical protein